MAYGERSLCGWPVIGCLWALEFSCVALGVAFTFVLEYVWHMNPCMLCLVDRFLWIVYAAVLLRAWRLEAYGRVNNRWVFGMDILRYFLIALAIFHLELVKGTYDFCMSSDLMALHGGLWSWFAHFDFRNCADEPMLFGFLNIPIGLLVVYLFWELVGAARLALRHKRS